MKRLIAAVLSLFITAAGAAGAVYVPEVESYDAGVDYLVLMREAAEDGSEYALAMGAVYEQQRNNKIAEMSLDYEQTAFFDGRSGSEVLESINTYLAPQNSAECEMTYLGRYYITGYDTCARCCGWSTGITASGAVATVGRTIAAGREFAFGTRLYIDGIGERVVEDRGVGNGKIDVLCSNHSECFAITSYRDVWLIENEE